MVMRRGRATNSLAGSNLPRGSEITGGAGWQIGPWRTAAECIDWSIPAPSIFDRKSSLAENTLKRIVFAADQQALLSKALRRSIGSAITQRHAGNATVSGAGT